MPPCERAFVEASDSNIVKGMFWRCRSRARVSPAGPAPIIAILGLKVGDIVSKVENGGLMESVGGREGAFIFPASAIVG